MMHGSTSPFYPMIACLDVAAAMMDGPGGHDSRWGGIARRSSSESGSSTFGRELAKGPDGGAPWFFGVWQPDEVRDPCIEQRCRCSPSAATRCWRPSHRAGASEPDQRWHGFGELDSGYCMLDPTKVTFTTPGIDATGHLAQRGIPAPVVAATSTAIASKSKRPATTACWSCSP